MIFILASNTIFTAAQTIVRIRRLLFLLIQNLLKPSQMKQRLLDLLAAPSLCVHSRYNNNIQPAAKFLLI